MLTALREIGGTPILAKNHFKLIRECEDCVPYLVLKIADSPGLRTSSGTQIISNVELKAYFSADRKSTAFQYRDLIRSWIETDGCIDLGECGCFCVRNPPSIRITTATGGMVLCLVTFSGTYNSIAASESLSESV